MEAYVPIFVKEGYTPITFRNITPEQLDKMDVTKEDQKKLLTKLSELKADPAINLEDLSWEIPWSDISIEKEIGEGSYGKVFKGIWKGKEVAVKQLREAKEESLKEFLSEIEVMKKIRLHENVVNLYGMCKSPHLAIISEYMPLGSLDNVLPVTNLTLEIFIRFAKGAANGMTVLHSQNIIHRDIACRNLLVWKDSRGELTIKLTDFGLSRFHQDLVNRKNEDFGGPSKWMAPEAFLSKFTKKSDVWSYGVTLVEMWTKKDPYPNESALHVAIAVQQHQKTPQVPQGLPSEIEVLMKDCWKFNPEQRPHFSDIATRLDQLLFRVANNRPNKAIIGVRGKN